MLFVARLLIDCHCSVLKATFNDYYSSYINKLSESLLLYSVLIIGVVTMIVFSAKRWKTLSKAEQKDFSKKIAIWGGLGLVLVLISAGRAHWVTGLLAGLVAIASRASQLAAYFPVFKNIFGESTKAQAKEVDLSNMSRQQAADTLGIEIAASKEDIRLAHKKLIQKIHPDRGGSELLAKQINTAKDVLLK